MNDLIRKLYNLSEELDENKHLYEAKYQTISQNFDALMDQLKATDFQFHENLYGAIMDYIILEENISFLYGLRLGLQLQAL